MTSELDVIQVELFRDVGELYGKLWKHFGKRLPHLSITANPYMDPPLLTIRYGQIGVVSPQYGIELDAQKIHKVSYFDKLVTIMERVAR